MHESLMISVIIPVYNAEKFIDRAVQSVLCQMDGSIELILVDDGSTDRSGTICDTYAAEYPLIRVIHKENGGLSSARNTGMRIAQGEYISFLDADDYVDSNSYNQLIPILREFSPDCLDFGWRYVNSYGVSAPNYHGVTKNTLLSRQTIRDTILPPLLNIVKDDAHFIFPYTWNKVYKVSVLRENNVLFDETRRTWEDRPFLVHFLKYCNTFYSMDACFYNYVDVPDSLSRKFDLQFFQIILDTYRHYTTLYGSDYDFESQYAINYWCNAIENMIFRSLEQTENQEQIRQNISQTLSNAQVIQWYTYRNPKDAFEQRINRMVLSGQHKKTLAVYEKVLKGKQRQQTIAMYSGAAKRLIKKLIGRR